MNSRFEKLFHTIGCQEFIFCAVNEVDVAGVEVIGFGLVVYVLRNTSCPKHQMPESRFIAQHPSHLGSASLRKSHQNNGHVFREYRRVMPVKRSEVIAVVVNFCQPVFPGHPGSANIAAEAFPVKAGKPFRSKDKGIGLLNGFKFPNKIFGRLAITVAGDPPKPGMGAGLAQGIVMRRFVNAQGMCFHVVFLLFPILFS